MPQETEEEDEFDEEISIDGLDDVEKFLNEEDDSDFVLEEDEVREVLASAWKQKRPETSRERLRRGFGKPSKPVTAPVTRKFRAEVEELKLRTECNRCGSVRHWSRECPQKSSQGYKGGGRGNQPWKKNEHLAQKAEREAYFCDWGCGDELSVSSRANMAPCWKRFADAVNNVVPCWRTQKKN